MILGDKIMKGNSNEKDDEKNDKEILNLEIMKTSRHLISMGKDEYKKV